MPVITSCPQKRLTDSLTEGTAVRFSVVNTQEPWYHLFEAEVTNVFLSFVPPHSFRVKLRYELRHRLAGPDSVPMCATERSYETTVTGATQPHQARRAVVGEVLKHLEEEAFAFLCEAVSVLYLRKEEGEEVSDHDDDVTPGRAD